MTYISNTITDPNSPAAMCTALENALTAEGYTLVDTVVISTRTHRVWRNPAANNPTGKNWYLEVAYVTSGAGMFGTYVMEDYNEVTHLGYRMVEVSNPVTPSAANQYSYFGTTGYTLEHTSRNLRAGFTNYGSRELNLPATSFGYWISVTPSRVMMLFSGSPDTIYYSGSYEMSPQHTAAAGANAFPLVSAVLKGQGTTTYEAGLTRYPNVTVAVNTYDMAGSQLTNFHSVFRSPSIPSGHTGGSGRFALRVPLHTTGSSANVFWGWFIDIAGVNASATVTRGDTVTDPSSATWTLTSPSSGYSLMMKQV